MSKGLILLSLFSVLLLISCASSPLIELCQTEAKLGTATCVLKDGNIRIMKSSQLNNYSCIPNEDFEEYVNWCHND